ncbi:type 2 lantipeptide synthetase LanM [Luteimonas sp. S4-F44]|uniref:type 2 lantipeptide synthetase LanM n=1 Tax=Luteimonas sp. S4-F44 TaxID=2925842 RepID=UPI001F534A89|nr:type 2 lantipeptide synthetase LanM [Luteimonas sp. S4-F44]UNK43667.1 type 2 lantipeptide synthetase LanM [Luteimonas sp. S4-F44]
MRRLARGDAGALLPPVARQRADGLIEPLRTLRGGDDARSLAVVLARPAFAAFVEMLETLGPWCRALGRTHADLFGARVFGLGNAALFAPLVSEAFVRCAIGGVGHRDEVAERCRLFRAFLIRFAARLRRDLQAGVFGDALRGPVVGLWASPSETHNGGQRVLCLRLRDGTRIAYKPRPVDGERIFLADAPVDGRVSIFAWLNGLAPVSGPVRLPTLRVWRGVGRDRWTYSWQDWVERPRDWGLLDPQARPAIEGARLSPRAVRAYWRSAGALGVACQVVGATDLGESNVLCGVRSGARDPMPHVVDLEVFGCRMQRMTGTGLVASPAHRCGGHPAFASRLRPDDVEGPAAAFFVAPGGTLRLRRPTAAWARRESRAAVADAVGNIGPARQLPAMLRGMFDTWTCLLQHRQALHARLRASLQGGWVRVLPKLTSTYARALENGADDGNPANVGVPLCEEERTQLARGDVPYFFAPLDGGAPRALAAPSFSRARRVGPLSVEVSSLLPDLDGLLAQELDFVDLATLIHDVVAHAFPELGRDAPDTWRDGAGWRLRDPALGVDLRIRSIHAGSAHFDWAQAGCRVAYRWNRQRIEVRALPLPADPPRLRAVGRRLLAIQRLDGALRRQWAVDGFRDRETAARLRTLTQTALAWLESVLDAHGWPTVARVGPRACEAAVTLAQHADRRDATLQRRCLALVHAAAVEGDVPLRHLAYLTDAVCVNAGHRQRYGTKFRRRQGTLVPYPLQSPTQVDTWRRQMGLPPLAEYRALLHRVYGGGGE